jgi:hypothetical protein
MKKIQKTVLKLSIISLAAVTILSCEEGGSEIPFIRIEHVKEFTRDSLRTYMEYGGEYDRPMLIQYQVEDVIRSNSGILYTSLGMTCTIDALTYNIKLQLNGGSRALEISANIGNSVVYYVEYYYDVSGRLYQAKIIRPAEGSEEWVSYQYNADNIEINENGRALYSIPLSTEENTGYVCNAYAFTEAPLTNRYVINPDLYFLGIYGIPVEKLPAGQIIERVGSNDSRISRVGKYYYKY